VEIEKGVGKIKKYKKKNRSMTNEKFRAERIDGKKVVCGTILYFVKWIGCSEEENTWESISTIKSDYLIGKFLKELEECRGGKNRNSYDRMIDGVIDNFVKKGQMQFIRKNDFIFYESI